MIGKITVPFRVLVLCLYLFLLGPMLIVVPLSFSNDSYRSFRRRAGACAGTRRCSATTSCCRPFGSVLA